jgi:hypothetical protein
MASLAKGDTVIETDVQLITPMPAYVLIKLNNYKLELSTAQYPGLITTYTKGSFTDLMQINLPTEIIETGLWEVIFYNDRVKQRQSLSEALRPRSDN